MNQADIYTSEYIVEFIVPWMQADSMFTEYANLIQPFIQIPKDQAESILVIHNGFTESDPFGKTQIDFMVIAKTLPRSKKIALDIFRKLRGRVNLSLPIPTELPEGKTAADFNPITIRKIFGNNVRMIGNVLNGEYRYNASFFIQ